LTKFGKVCYNQGMTTVNVSLTTPQVKWIDQMSDKLGFANRSEFVRSLLRFVSGRPDLLSGVESFPFTPPSTKSKTQILEDFKSSGKYSAAFLKDLEAGLSRSDYFSS